MNNGCMKYGVALFAVVLLAGCGSSDDVAGSGNKSPNAPACGITGTVVTDGFPAEGAQAVLYRITDDDSASITWAPCGSTFTDICGVFLFDGVAAGSYAVDFQKDGYGAFSGYLTCTGPDDGINLDTVRLGNTYNIVGMFRETVYEAIRIGLVGTGGYADASVDTAYIAQDRFFVMDGVAGADYRMLFNLDKDDGTSIHLETDFPAHASLGADTSYTDHYENIISTVRLQDGLIRIDNALFTLVCLIETDVTPGVTAKKTMPVTMTALLRSIEEESHEE